MIAVTWKNIMPPGYLYKDYDLLMLGPALYENPRLKPAVQRLYGRKKPQLPGQCGHNELSRMYLKNTASWAKQMMALLVEEVSSGGRYYRYGDYPVRLAFRAQWETLLQEPTCPVAVGTAAYSVYKEYIRLFFRSDASPADFSECMDRLSTAAGVPVPRRSRLEAADPVCTFDGQTYSLARLLQSVADQSQDDEALFLDQLSVLSVTACVWDYWVHLSARPEAARQLLTLIGMLFPQERPETREGESRRSAPGDDARAEALCRQAQSLWEGGAVREAGALCEQALREAPDAYDVTRGQLFALLAECCAQGYPLPAGFHNVEEIQRSSASCRHARISPDRPALSGASGQAPAGRGCYLLNEENEASAWVDRTAPGSGEEGWERIVSADPAALLLRQERGLQRRVLLIGDDLSRNMKDALAVLRTIRQSLHSHASDPADWQDTSIFLRCREETAMPLLDTALSYFGEDPQIGTSSDLFRLYLIDEEKRSAEELYARHPLFYPLLRAGNTDFENKKMHLVIVSDDPRQRCAQWLIREGFWMLPRLSANVDTAITVLSPQAEQLCSAVTMACPGLRFYSDLNGVPLPSGTDPGREETLRSQVCIDSMTLPRIHYRTAAFEDMSLQDDIMEICRSNDSLYFVVDSRDDLSAIALAARLREMTIRHSVEANRIRSYDRLDNAVIAVRCQNPDFAELVRDLVVPGAPSDYQTWYSSYRLIPFGSRADFYTWDQLCGGTIETRAQCMHLQYCGAGQTHAECINDLHSYFGHLYNRDSSYAAALSLPYRLFEAGGLRPDNWDITDRDAWWSPEALAQLADRLEAALRPHGKEDLCLLSTLAEYEHMRWYCYEISRGWLPLTAQQTIQCILAGSPRHTLQIARLHPCLCSWDDLEDLHQAFCRVHDQFSVGEGVNLTEKQAAVFRKFTRQREAGDNFQTLDYSNIRDTGKILRGQWQLEPETEPKA